ncbi:MAG: CvpA family protein [Chromatiaceae bacterium]|nr:CvpA family protein [Chromatiaceae bacterium]
MNWVDYLILAILTFSAILGLARGLIREVLSLAIWIAALVVAWLFHREVADLLATQLSQPALRLGIAFVGLVLVTLFAGTLLGALLTTLVARSGLSAFDHLLGLVFGAARGAVIVAMAVFLIGLTPLASAPWWQASLLVDEAEAVAAWLIDQVPPRVQARLRQL